MAQTHDYLGYAKDEQPFAFDSRELWDEADDGGGGSERMEGRGRDGLW